MEPITETVATTLLPSSAKLMTFNHSGEANNVPLLSRLSISSFRPRGMGFQPDLNKRDLEPTLPFLG